MTRRAQRLERSYAYHLAQGTWSPAIVAALEAELPNAPDAAPAARGLISDRFGDLLTEEDLEIVDLLVTELVANAVAHAGLGEEDTLVLHLAVSPERIRAEVCDGGSGFDPVSPARPEHEPGGYGLVMVDRAASRWGVATDDGSCVWFEIDRLPAG